MSRAAVNQIIDRAVGDEAFFEVLRNDPASAIAGMDLDENERHAFLVGAYNVAVRAARRELEERAARAAAATHPEPVPAVPAEAPTPEIRGGRRSSGAVVAGSLLALIVVLAGGSAGFRYFQQQWPWQALGVGQTIAPASIPTPSLGARPRASASPSGVRTPVGTPPRSSSASLAPSGSARASGSAPASANPASAQVGKAYYEKVSQRLGAVLSSYSSTLEALRAGNDATKPIDDLSASLRDLGQQLPGAVPPDNLGQEHKTLVEAVPLLLADTNQLKAAIEQKNQTQAVLIASEMEAIFAQLQDEVAFANAAHPEFYQAIESSQPLAHVGGFDVVQQNVQRTPGVFGVTLRIMFKSANPGSDEIADTLHHGIVVARESYPQATKVEVVGYKAANGQLGPQVGTADWYCGPNSRPAGANASANWQDSCGKVYFTPQGGSTPTVSPY